MGKVFNRSMLLPLIRPGKIESPRFKNDGREIMKKTRFLCRDPLMILLFAIVGIGYTLTLTSYLLDPKPPS